MSAVIKTLSATFAEAFNAAEGAFKRAAQIYVDAIKEHGETVREQFAADFPRISSATWRRLEALGNGAMDARLVSAGSCGAAALRRLPVHVQTRYLDEGVALLIANGETLRVAIDNLTPAQARQAIAGDHVRDEAEQRAWLEAQSPATAIKPSGAVSWQVKAGKVQVYRPCQLTRLDLARMLAEMG